MIKIEERLSHKAVGKTSIFISFPYNLIIIEAIKSADNYVYDPKTHEWELPISKLAYIIDTLTMLDDILLNLLDDVKSEKLTLVVEHKLQPFKHQSEAIDWAINRNTGLILDAPGLGKTTEVIYTAEELKKQKGIEHCLIICCINTLKLNWKKEILKFSTESCRIIGEKVNKKGVVTYASTKDRAEELYNELDEFFIIINIESLRESLVVDAILNSKNKFDMIVADEVHRTKDPNSQQGKSFQKIAKAATYRFCLTGTVLVNSPFDAYAPLKFIGYEKANWSTFKAYYGRFEQLFGHMLLIGYKNIDSLKAELSECSIRRTKDLLDLPPKIIIPEYLEMSTNLQKFYEDLQNGIVEEADRVNIKNSSLLGMVTRLRQAATCPSVLSSTVTDNVKIDRCKELVAEITSSGEKVIIFSNFKEPLYILADELKQYKPIICTGDQTDEEVSNRIDLFLNDTNYKVILCTTQKMGTGITLHAASYEIFLDCSWTAAMEEQAQDRAHRLGLTKSLTIYQLIAKGTIDERIQDILQSKAGISDFIVDDDTNLREELRKLLGIELRKQW